MNFNNEDEYKKYLEENFFPSFFDNGWKPEKKKTKERQIRRDTKNSRVDYFGMKNGVPTYVEVKNDRIRQKYLLQIVRYYCECNQENYQFNLYVICHKKIRPHREKVLEKLGVTILDINEVCSGRLDQWM